MDKVKPLTIGIFALLLVLLSFNFIPKSPKPAKPKTESTESLTIESNATLIQSNAELIQKNIDFLKKNLAELKANSAEESLDSLPKEESQNNNEENLDLQNSSNATKKLEELETPQTAQEQMTQEQNPMQQAKCERTKPQLAIIIDDISTPAQYRAITKIQFKITPSLFPKSKANPQTPKIAQNAPFYMVHLPLEALNFYQKEHEWLFVGDSQEKIERRIQAIKRDFPTLTYLNNHTGSKFTQDSDSMALLLETLAKHKINFVDSKTASNTKTSAFYSTHFKETLNPCQKEFLARDVFLDNELNIPKITQNLIQAVKIAKTKGYAIAIGHPHKETFLTLKNAEDYLAKSGVEIVYVNEIIAP